ncbi:hypothetical protein KJ819_03520 [Patescibacteria group bacterium]|nr:hypothetical protein [Patescibacteria group bacterium]MBU1500538.1 hypothetical protein [Patescibacteria group bacterium]MBU2080427.1 hypothetical protein [Patescibacteria group bacterium]MBU2123768.1 hypothetical protein [Patescibacteria group bacterium]MBU2194624.1 hypothetical protein [Patescibacteria group bacterium]
MNTKKQLTLAWSVAGILAVLLIIALFVIMNPKKDLGTVLQEGKEDITAQRARIAEVCSGPNAGSKSDCQDELEVLSQLLRDFSNDINSATSSAAQ